MLLRRMGAALKTVCLVVKEPVLFLYLYFVIGISCVDLTQHTTTFVLRFAVSYTNLQKNVPHLVIPAPLEFIPVKTGTRAGSGGNPDKTGTESDWEVVGTAVSGSAPCPNHLSCNPFSIRVICGTDCC